MKKVLVVLAAVMAVAVSCAWAQQSVESVMAGIRTPDDIARFFEKEFTYTMNMPDRAHTPEETIASMSGDCEDFAILASEMLTRIGIRNDVLIISFKGMRMAHAVCIWKEKSGYYSFISNQELQRTGQVTAEGAIRKFFPDCRMIASIDPKMYVKKSSSSEIASVKSYDGAELMTDLDPRNSIGI